MKNNINKKIGATLLTAAIMTGSFVMPVVKATGEEEKPTVSYQAHVQDIGWQEFTSGIAGTTGKSLRMEAIKVKLENCENVSLSFDAHIQDIGWIRDLTQESVIGTEGRSLRLEAIVIRANGLIEKGYKLQYRVHVQDIDWTPWVDEGTVAGTEGRSLRVEAIEIRLVEDETSALVLAKKEANTTLNDYDIALSTTLSEKAYEAISQKIATAMENINNAKTEEEVKVTFDKIVAEIKKACPTIEDLSNEVIKDRENQQTLTLTYLNNYAEIVATVEGLTEYDLGMIETIIENAKEAVENARTAEDVKTAKKDFDALIAKYPDVTTKVNEVNRLVEAQNEAKSKLDAYRNALKDVTNISEADKKIIKDEIDMFEEKVMEATKVEEVTNAKTAFDNFIAKYPTLEKTANATLLQEAVDSAIEKLTPYLTYRNDTNVNEDTGLGDVGQKAQDYIDEVNEATTPEEIATIVNGDENDESDIGAIATLDQMIKTIEDNIKADYDAYVKAYEIAVAELDEYASKAEELELDEKETKTIKDLIENTKGNISIVKTDDKVEEYMELFRDAISKYSSELAEYALEQTRNNAIEVLKSYEEDYKNETTTVDGKTIAKVAQEARAKIEAKSNGKYTIQDPNVIKSTLKQAETDIAKILNAKEVSAAKAGAIEEFRNFLDSTKYSEEVRTLASNAIKSITDGTFADERAVNEAKDQLMEAIDKQLEAEGESRDEALKEAKEPVLAKIQEYKDIATKSKVDNRIKSAINSYETQINEAATENEVKTIESNLDAYINTTIIKTKLEKIKEIEEIDLSAYTNVSTDRENNPTVAIIEAIDAQIENIKKASSDKINETVVAAKKAIEDLAAKIDELEGTRKTALGELKAYYEAKTDKDENLYNSYVKEMNAVTLENYVEDVDGNNNDTFAIILNRAKAAFDNYKPETV